MAIFNTSHLSCVTEQDLIHYVINVRSRKQGASTDLQMVPSNRPGQSKAPRAGLSQLLAAGVSGQLAGLPRQATARGRLSYRAACWSGCRWARADGPGGKYNRDRGVNAGRRCASRALVSRAQPPPGRARARMRTGRVEEAGQGSQSGPQIFQPGSPHLHPFSTSASGQDPGPA